MQVMDKADYLNQNFFQGDNLSEGGQEFMKRINDYRTEIAKLVPAGLKSTVEATF